MEFVDTLIGAGVAGLFFMLGIARERSRTPEPPKPYAPPPPPDPICGCGHNYAFHEIETGECTSLNTKLRYVRPDGTKSGHPPCTCRRYTGPEPLPTYI